jgi:hypothetical protein
VPNSSFTAEGIALAAKRLGVDVPTVRAVAEVESNGNGFLPDGRPKILFERHLFARLTDHRFDNGHPDISNPAAGNYDGGAAEYLRLYRAAQLDADAAIQSASWGGFQILGLNWAACGEKSLYGFLLAMHHDADAHLALFASFVVNKGLADELQRKDWAGFAKSYNGHNFRANRYHDKLSAAYARLAA